MSKNRFTAVKEKMDSNFDSSLENDDQYQNEEIKNASENKTNQSDENVEKLPKVSKPSIKSAPAKVAVDDRITRKTIGMPLALALAVKEIKERRNLALQKGKGRTTDDDIVVEALQLYFNQSGEFIESLELAETKLRNYS